MKRITIVLLLIEALINPITVQAKDKPAYRIFTGEGKEVDYDKMIKELSKNQVILKLLLKN